MFQLYYLVEEIFQIFLLSVNEAYEDTALWKSWFAFKSFDVIILLLTTQFKLCCVGLDILCIILICYEYRRYTEFYDIFV